MLGHGIVSPILLGIKDNTGFGNNAEELRTASILMDNIVIRPFQEEIIEGINDILNFNKIYLNLYFVTLQQIEFTELDNISTRVKREEETGEKLSSDEVTDFTDEEGDDMLEQLEALGERISDDWELIHSEEVKASEKDFDLANLADINAAPSKKSKQDRGIFKVRYAYMPLRQSPNSREFCKRMELYTQDNIVFRKEDIGLMSFRGVNKKLGHKGRNYSLFDDTKVSVNQAAKDGFVEPNNPSEVSVRPADMPNAGAYPNS